MKNTGLPFGRCDGFPGQRSVALPRSVIRGIRGIASDIFPTDIGYYPTAAYHHVCRPDGSPQMILAYCFRGQGWLEVCGHRHQICGGQVMGIVPETPHRYGADSQTPWTIYWLHASGHRVKDYMKLLNISVQSPVFPMGDEDKFIASFEEIFGLLHQGYGSDELLLAGTALSHLLGRLAVFQRKRLAIGGSANDPIQHVITFMRQNLSRRFSVSDFAAIAHLSPSHFASVFRRHAGYSVLDYFLRLKMRHACQLLDSTNLPIKAIALQLGFRDQLYFSRRFRSIYDLSPRAYRQFPKG